MIIMYILIKNKDYTFKSEIKQLIEEGKIKTWKFIIEDDRMRLMHIGETNQYNDVVLRFLTSYSDGVECLKIVPSVKNDATNIEEAKDHFGIVLGRFSEMLNTHFAEIGSYETILA